MAPSTHATAQGLSAVQESLETDHQGSRTVDTPKPQPASPSEKPQRASAWVGLAIASLALLTRALEAVQQGHLFNDGPRFIAMAEAFGAGAWREALQDTFHPLTALLMATLAGPSGLSLEAAAQCISVGAGGLAAWVCWDLTRRIFEPRIALAAGLVFALQPRLVASSSGVQSDGLHLALFMLATWAAWLTLARRQQRFALLCGIACALAYLTRPEGIAVGLVLLLWLGADASRRDLSVTRAAQLGFGFLACFALFSGPYVFALHEITGDWMLTGKKSLRGLLDLSSLPLSSVPRRLDPASLFELKRATLGVPVPLSRASAGGLVAALLEVVGDAAQALQAPAIGLLALGLSRGRPGRGTRFVLSFVGLFALLLLALRLEAGYVSRRHWLVVVGLLTPFIGRGGLRIFDILLYIPWLRPRPGLRWIGVTAVILAFLAHAGIPQTEPHKIARQKAAQWLRSHSEHSVVAATRARDAYFAGAERYVELRRPEDYAPSEAEPALRILEEARTLGAQFILMDADGWPAGRALPEWTHEKHRASHRGRVVLVLQVVEPTEGPEESRTPGHRIQ